MKIAVASGKGGTGKTTVATNMAYVASSDGHTVAYLDCDVEEPNGALFLRPDITESDPVRVSIPKVDLAKCTGCGFCGQICQYSAIVPLKGKVLVFPELCHGCGGCWLVCAPGAITESHRDTGRIEQGHADKVQFVQGILDIGQAMSPPVIRAVKAAAPDADLVMIDAPPGTSCPVIASVSDSDYVLLVTEPTPFGLNDLKLAVEMVRVLGLPFGVVVNRTDGQDGDTHAWCRGENIPILAEIPEDRRVAEIYSRGEMICEALPEYARLFSDLLTRVKVSVHKTEPTPDGRSCR
jgi:MinD superfamily P-loop ATPase